MRAPSCRVAPALEAAWSQHLADYELVPLFPQVGRGEPPASHVGDRHLTPDPRPGLLAIEVRSRAKRAGYSEVRGDGGYIECFVKSLPTLDRALVLETEGIEAMALKDATVKVTGLVLREGADTHAGGTSIAWSRAGSVMRAEGWAELSEIVR